MALPDCPLGGAGAVPGKVGGGPGAGRGGPLSEPLPVGCLPLGLRGRPSSKSWSFLDGGPSACREELPGHPALG